MRLTIAFLALGLAKGGLSAACRGGWLLEPDDCICMNSTNGDLLEWQTQSICNAMGYRTADKVRLRLLHCAVLLPFSPLLVDGYRVW